MCLHWEQKVQTPRHISFTHNSLWLQIPFLHPDFTSQKALPAMPQQCIMGQLLTPVENFALLAGPVLDTSAPFSPCPFQLFPILLPKSNTSTKDGISMDFGFFHLISLDFLFEAIMVFQPYWSVFIAQRGEHKTVCDLQKSNLFCLYFSVPYMWLFGAYIKIKIENVAFVLVFEKLFLPFLILQVRKAVGTGILCMLGFFVYLSIRMISEILSLPRFTTVKWGQNLVLWGKLLLEIIRNTFLLNKGCWLFAVIQQSVLRILLMNKGELC